MATTTERPRADRPRTESSRTGRGRPDSRFGRRRWARRLAHWRLVVAGLVVACLVGGGAWLVGWSSVLSVEGVEVTGTGTALSSDRVRQVAAVPEGQPLARVDLDAIRARVESLVAVREADVSRQWPDQVRIDVTERRAVALVEVGDRLRGLDIEGVAFQEYDGDPPALPRVETAGSVTAEALREAARVVTALPPDLSRRVASVSVESVDGIALQLRDGRPVRWGSADSSDLKAEVLDSMLRLDAPGYDVSVPARPISCAASGCV